MSEKIGFPKPDGLPTNQNIRFKDKKNMVWQYYRKDKVDEWKQKVEKIPSKKDKSIFYLHLFH